MALAVLPRQMSIDQNGVPRVAAKLYYYQAGTTTPITTYTTAAYAVAHPSPVPSVSSGLFPAVYINPAVNATFKLVVKDADDVTLFTEDNVPTENSTLRADLAAAAVSADGGLLVGIRREETGSVARTVASKLVEFLSILDFGAVPDGVTDNTVAIQAAVTAAASLKAKVRIPSTAGYAQSVYVCGKVSVPEGVTIFWDPGAKILSAVTNANDHVFECVSTYGTATALTANATKRDSTVAVTSASGLAVGQVVCIRDNVYKYTANGRNLEFNEIDSIAGTTITLKNRLIGSYATAQSAELVPLSAPARDIHFIDPNIEIPATKDGGHIYFSDAYRCTTNRGILKGAKGQPAVQMWRSAYCEWNFGSCHDGQSLSTAGYGYGANVAQSSHHCTVRGVKFKNVRECAVASNARFCYYIDCESVSPYDNGFNSHADGSEDCYFINCRVAFARSKGFVSGFTGSSAADKRIHFIDCEAYFCGSYGFWSGADSGRENEDIEFVNPKVFHPSDDTATTYGILVSRCTRPRIINPSIDADGEANCRAGIYLEICTDARVSGGTVRSATSGWGLIHSQCTGVDVDGLGISNIGTAQGVHAEGTNSTKVVVRNCRVDNDVQFTKNSGDLHRDNTYSTKLQNASGSSAAVADGGTITHGLVGTPTSVRAQSSVSGEFISVTAVGATTFTVAIKKHDNTAGTSQTVYWEAAA
jgi:hypothetical protein